MKRGKISIGTIAFFVAIGILRGCQDYNLQKENQPASKIREQIEQIKFDDVFIPADSNHDNIINFTYKK